MINIFKCIDTKHESEQKFTGVYFPYKKSSDKLIYISP